VRKFNSHVCAGYEEGEKKKKKKKRECEVKNPNSNSNSKFCDVFWIVYFVFL
jgi:hypothetical protein